MVFMVTRDQINDGWGFDEIRDHVGRYRAEELFNGMVEILEPTGENPDKAIEFLNSSNGRHFVDSLTFIVNFAKVSNEELLNLIKKQRTERNLAWFFKAYQKFTPEPKETAESVVDDLLDS
jgi:hypothetical protein